MATKKIERAYLENQGMEKTLERRLLEIESQRNEFIRQFVKVHENIKIEALKKKDEVFRIKFEKSKSKKKHLEADKFVGDDRDLLLPKEISMSLDHTSFHTNGLLNCPGIQSRYNRAKNISRVKLHFDDDITDEDDDVMYDDDVIDRGRAIGNDVVDMQDRSRQSVSLSRNNSAPGSPWQPTNAHAQSNFSLVAPKLGFGSHKRGFTTAGLRPATTMARRPKVRPRDPNRPITGDAHIRNSNHNKGSCDVVDPPLSPGRDVIKKDDAPVRLMTSSNRFQSKLAQLKREVHMNEKEYQMKMRLKRQIIENDDVTSKVWSYIGKRPISVRLNMMMTYDPGVTDDRLTEDEVQVLRMRAAINARKRRR